MRLNELLRQDDFKKLEVIGGWKTIENEYIVIGERGKSSFPIAGLTHPIRIYSDDKNPEVSPVEEMTIRRRFNLKLPPISRSQPGEITPEKK